MKMLYYLLVFAFVFMLFNTTLTFGLNNEIVNNYFNHEDFHRYEDQITTTSDNKTLGSIQDESIEPDTNTSYTDYYNYMGGKLRFLVKIPQDSIIIQKDNKVSLHPKYTGTIFEVSLYKSSGNFDKQRIKALNNSGFALSPYNDNDTDSKSNLPFIRYQYSFNTISGNNIIGLIGFAHSCSSNIDYMINSFTYNNSTQFIPVTKSMLESFKFPSVCYQSASIPLDVWFRTLPLP